MVKAFNLADWFGQSLIARLRHEDEARAIKPWTSVEQAPPNVPDSVVQQLGARFSPPSANPTCHLHWRRLNTC